MYLIHCFAKENFVTYFLLDFNYIHFTNAYSEDKIISGRLNLNSGKIVKNKILYLYKYYFNKIVI